MEDLKSLGGKLFSRKPFKRLQNLQLLEQKSSEEFQIECFTGEYVSKNELIPCIFRKIRSASTDALLQSAISELKVIQSVRNSLLFVEYFGYYFDEQKSEYLQISKRYKKTLFDTKFYKDLAIEVTYDILKGIQFLHENEFYHGAISPFNIFLDEFNIVKIGNLWHAGEIKEFKRNFEQWGRTSSFLNMDFVPPEVMLLQRFKAAGLRMKIFRPRKSDMFSIGLTIMHIAGVSVEGLNVIEMDITSFENKPVNSSDINLEPIEEKKLFHLQRKIDISIFTIHLDLLRSICGNSLAVFYMERVTVTKIIQEIKSKNLIVPVPSREIYYQILHESSNRKYLRHFNELIFHFSHFMHSIRKLPEPPEESLSEPVSDQSRLALIRETADVTKKYKDTLDYAYNSFFDSKCNEPFNVYDGIFVFLRSFFLDISDEPTLNSIHRLSTGFEENHNFVKCFNFIVNEADEITRNYLVTAILLLRNDINDWEYFFTSDLNNYPKPIPIHTKPKLIKKIKKILSCKIVSELLKKIYKMEINGVLDTQILPKLFLLKTIPSHHALTTYDLRSYIENFELDSSVASKGAICVVILREIGNIITRLDCKTRRDVKDHLAPVEGNVLMTRNEENLSEKQKLKMRDEAGFELEKAIFGGEVTSINDSSTEVLFNMEKYQKIEKFREDFKQKNEDWNESISIGRNTFFNGVRCPMRYM